MDSFQSYPLFTGACWHDPQRLDCGLLAAKPYKSVEPETREGPMSKLSGISRSARGLKMIFSDGALSF